MSPADDLALALSRDTGLLESEAREVLDALDDNRDELTGWLRDVGYLGSTGFRLLTYTSDHAACRQVPHTSGWKRPGEREVVYDPKGVDAPPPHGSRHLWTVQL